jgi:hypothetical protein
MRVGAFDQRDKGFRILHALQRQGAYLFAWYLRDHAEIHPEQRAKTPIAQDIVSQEIRHQDALFGGLQQRLRQRFIVIVLHDETPI